jgi:hypothetical protein
MCLGSHTRDVDAARWAITHATCTGLCFGQRCFLCCTRCHTLSYYASAEARFETKLTGQWRRRTLACFHILATIVSYAPTPAMLSTVRAGVCFTPGGGPPGPLPQPAGPQHMQVLSIQHPAATAQHHVCRGVFWRRAAGTASWV